MFILYTTEEMLYRICQEASSEPIYDLWYRIILSTKQVAIDKQQVNTQNEWIQVLHKIGVKIFTEQEWLERVFQDNDLVIEEPTASFLLDLSQEHINNLRDKYGMACYATNSLDKPPFFSNRGWHINTSDPDQEKSWNALLSGLSIPSNSIIILDRYFFSSNAGESIEDSFTNLRQILELLLPPTSKNGLLDVSIIFDFGTIKDKKLDGGDLDMAYLAKRINKIKKDINRPYAYNISLISINANCLNYEKTHNRKIFSNYYIIRAEHKLKAYNERRGALCDQELTFSYIFSDGLYDRSTIPEKTKDQTIKTLQEIIKSELKAIEPQMEIYRNGKRIPISDYTNILLSV